MTSCTRSPGRGRGAGPEADGGKRAVCRYGAPQPGQLSKGALSACRVLGTVLSGGSRPALHVSALLLSSGLKGRDRSYMA